MAEHTAPSRKTDHARWRRLEFSGLWDGVAFLWVLVAGLSVAAIAAVIDPFEDDDPR